jgi:hypothetical protein
MAMVTLCLPNHFFANYRGETTKTTTLHLDVYVRNDSSLLWSIQNNNNQIQTARRRQNAKSTNSIEQMLIIRFTADQCDQKTKNNLSIVIKYHCSEQQ